MVKESNQSDDARAREDEFYEIDLVDLMLTLWKRKLIIIATAILFAAGAGAYIVIAPKMYESTATVAFLPALSGSARITPDTYLTLATADDLLSEMMQEISSAADGEALTIHDLRDELSVEFAKPDKSRRTQAPTAMTASFRSKNPETATKILSAWARLFTEKSEHLPTDMYASASKSLEKSLDDAKKELAAVESRLLTYEKENPSSLLESRLSAKRETYENLLKQKEEKPTSNPDQIERAREEYTELNERILDVNTEVERLQHKINQLRESCDSLSKQYQELLIATSNMAPPLKVIENPTIPDAPASPRRMIILGLASLLGLFVGVTLALLIEMIAKRKSAA